MSKVLVAEDDAFLGNAYRLKLAKAGFDVKLARDGQEAIDALDEFKPDLVILDLMMPIKDGFATLSEIKASDKWKKIPVLVASNLGQKEDIDRSMGLGAIDYIVKSNMSINSVVDKIKSILNVS